MTSPISPISQPFVSPVAPNRGVATDRSAQRDEGTAADNLAGAIGHAVADRLGELDRLDQVVDEASQQAAVGSLESVSDFMIATAEAQLATEITVAVRDRAITAFNDIMRMQI